MKKIFSIIGIIVGFAFVVVGILSMTGALGGDVSYPSNAPAFYDSGYATFGADYYTYSVNNSAEAASGARAAAYNIGDIAFYLTMFCGIASILFGLVIACGFGIVFASCKDDNFAIAVKNVDPEIVNQPVTEEAPAADEAIAES